MFYKYVTDEVLDNGIHKCHLELTKTNADRIRAMTDEQLAEWLCRKADCNEYCCAYRSYCNKNDEACKQAWLDWLKEEVKT